MTQVFYLLVELYHLILSSSKFLLMIGTTVSSLTIDLQTPFFRIVVSSSDKVLSNLLLMSIVLAIRDKIVQSSGEGVT